MTSFSCTQTVTAPVLDMAGFVWFTVNGEVNSRNGNVAATVIDAALSVTLVWSGLDGATKIRNCRAAQAQLAARLAASGGRSVAQTTMPQSSSAALAATLRGPAAAAGPRAIRAVTVSPSGDTLSVGRRAQLVATARGADGAMVPGTTFVWSSSDTAVAVVSAAGLVTARAVGVSTIAAKADTVVGRVRIVVTRR